jgi:hypothetical protein
VVNAGYVAGDWESGAEVRRHGVAALQNAMLKRRIALDRESSKASRTAKVVPLQAGWRLETVHTAV